MKLSSVVCLLVCLFVATDLVGAKKSRKRGKKRTEPKWKSGSMPDQNTRFEVLKEHFPLTLNCKASGRPRPVISWYKDGMELFRSKRSRIQMKKYVLSIANTTTEDSGNYTCKVENLNGMIKWDFFVEVNKQVWPMELLGPENITTSVGMTAEFKCEVSNDPLATLKWKKVPIGPDGTVQIESGVDVESSEPGVLRLENVRKEDEGAYSCEASNVGGRKQSVGYLTVIENFEPALVPDFGQDGYDDDDLGLDDFDDDLSPYNRNNNRGNTRHNNYNNNNPWDVDPFRPDDPLIQRPLRPGEDPPTPVDFGPATTRRPSNRKKNKKGKKKKNRKNKNRKNNKKNRKNKNNRVFTTPDYYDIRTTRPTTRRPRTTPTTTTTTTATTTKEFIIYRTTPKVLMPYNPSRISTSSPIWNFSGNKKDNQDRGGVSDTRYNPGLQPPADDRVNTGPGKKDKEGMKEGDTATSKSSGKKNEERKGSVSAWTIYTVVGAVCGVILLIGLVAITLTLCCKQEQEGVYKSPTPV